MEDISDAIFDYNITEREDFTEYQNLPLAISYFVLSFIGQCANALIIYMFLWCAKMRSISNIYIFNMAVGDLLFVFGLLFTAAEEAMYDWPFGVGWCTIVQAIEVINSVVSVAFVMLMSIDRSVLLYRPLIASKYRKPKVAYLLGAAVWAVSLVAAVPRFLFGFVIDRPRICVVAVYNIIDAFIVPIFHFALAFNLPVLVIFTCILMISVKLQPAAHPIQDSKHKGSDRTRMVLMLFVVYLVCWSPLHLFNLYSFLPHLTPNLEFAFLPGFHTFAHVMAAIKACINPILYWYLSEDVRLALQSLLCCRKRSGTFETGERKQEEHPC